MLYLPSFPYVPSPQAKTFESLETAKIWDGPQEYDTIFLYSNPSITVGDFEYVFSLPWEIHSVKILFTIPYQVPILQGFLNHMNIICHFLSIYNFNTKRESNTILEHSESGTTFDAGKCHVSFFLKNNRRSFWFYWFNGRADFRKTRTFFGEIFSYNFGVFIVLLGWVGILWLLYIFCRDYSWFYWFFFCLFINKSFKDDFF